MRGNILLLMILFTVSSLSQTILNKNIGSTAGTNNVFTKVEPPPIFRWRMELNRLPKTKFAVNFSENFPESAKIAFRYADSIWSYLIASPETIHINAYWIELADTILGNTDSVQIDTNFTWALKPNTFYPRSLSEMISGTSQGDVNKPEMIIRCNSTKSWSYNVDGIPVNNKYDFVSVIMHEIAHGLGFYPSFIMEADTGKWGVPVGDLYYPFIYDHFCVDGGGFHLIDGNNPSVLLGDKLKSGEIYFDGINAQAVNKDSLPKLYAPSTWKSGVSISHLDINKFPNGNPNSLMKAGLNYAEVIHSPGEVGLAILEDLGWDIERIITVTAPIGGEVLRKGAVYTIKWSDNEGGYVSLELLRKDTLDGKYYSFANNLIIDTSSIVGYNEYIWQVDSALQDGEYKIKFFSDIYGYGLSYKITIQNLLKVATPQISPPAGHYDSSQYVYINCTTEGADIRYREDGLPPDSTNPQYTSGPIIVDTDRTIVARAFKSGYVQSDLSFAQYFIGDIGGTEFYIYDKPSDYRGVEEYTVSSTTYHDFKTYSGKINIGTGDFEPPNGENEKIRAILQWSLPEDRIPDDAQIIQAEINIPVIFHIEKPTVKLRRVNTGFEDAGYSWSATEDGVTLATSIDLWDSMGYCRFDSNSTFVSQLKSSLSTNKFQLAIISEQESQYNRYLQIDPFISHLTIIYRVPMRSVKFQNNLNGVYSVDSIRIDSSWYPSPHTAYFRWGTQVSFQATAKRLFYDNNNWKFSGWEAGVQPNPRTIIIKDPATYQANFSRVFDITLKNDYEGGEDGKLIYQGDTVNSGHNEIDIFYNQERTISAITPQTAGGITWNYYGWADGIDSLTRHISVQSTKDYIAKFKGPLRSTTSLATAPSNQRKIYSSGNAHYAVYASSGEVWYMKNIGGTWLPETLISSGKSTAKNPSIDGYNAYHLLLHFVWEETTEGGAYIYYRRFNSNASPQWSNRYLVGTVDGNFDGTPVVSAIAGTDQAIIVWKQYDGTFGYSDLQVRMDPLDTIKIGYDLGLLNGKLPSITSADPSGYSLVYINSDEKVSIIRFNIDQYGAPIITSGPLVMSGDNINNCSNPSIVQAGYLGKTFIAWDALNGSMRHVFFREGRFVSNQWQWQTRVEFNHGSHQMHSPSIGFNDSIGINCWGVNMVYLCGDHVARKSRDYDSTTWNDQSYLGDGYISSLSRKSDGPTQVLWPKGFAAPYSIFSRNIVNVPDTVGLSQPGPNATNVPLNVTLSWNATFNAGSYNVQVATDQSFTNIVFNGTGITTTSCQVNFDGLGVKNP